MAWDWLKGMLDMRKPTLGDVRVTGLVPDRHTIEDINVNVPYGMTVTIPAELAVQSKQLWLGISQHKLLQLGSASPAPKFLPPTALNQAGHKEREKLEAKVRELNDQIADLKTEVQSLRTENQSLRTNLAAKGNGAAATAAVMDPEINAKLDALMAALKSGVPMAGGVAGATTTPKREIADGEAPTFLPSQIKPEDAQVRIDVQGESSESASISSAAEKLRKLRKGGSR
jgi:hypothetical protein